MFRVTGLFIAIGMIAQSQEPIAGKKGINVYSKEKEAALGAMIAKQIRSHETILDNHTVLEYVRKLGRRLAARVPGDAVTMAFDVILDRFPGPHHEPLNVPAGQVFVRSGLFLAAQDEAEFAGMLAHGIAHVAKRHGTRSASRGQLVNRASLPLIYMGWWNTPDGSAVIPLGFLKFARQDELEADTLAVQLMASAGFNPSALI